MKPKHIARVVFMVVGIAASVLFLEYRRSHHITCCSRNTTAPADVPGTNNDFIFIESVNKFLMLPLAR